jgi:hypothetical protein
MVASLKIIQKSDIKIIEGTVERFSNRFFVDFEAEGRPIEDH